MISFSLPFCLLPNAFNRSPHTKEAQIEQQNWLQQSNKQFITTSIRMNFKHGGESVNNHESYFIMPLSPVKFVKQIAVCGLICEKLLKFLLLSRAALLERSCDWGNFMDFHYILCVDFNFNVGSIHRKRLLPFDLSCWYK